MRAMQFGSRVAGAAQCRAGCKCSRCRSAPGREDARSIGASGLAGPGRVLDRAVGIEIARRFDFDLSRLPIHQDSGAAAAASELHAQAYLRRQAHPGDNRMLFDGGKGDKAKEPKRDDSARSEGKTRAQQQSCYDKCGGAELGSIECKLGADGMPTAEVATTIRETDPCIRPCIERHEQVHARDIAPICRSVADCLKKAGNDQGKQDKCLDAYQAKLYGIIGGPSGTECTAYGMELNCLQRRRSAKECKQGDGPTRWKKFVERTQCYRDCFCRKAR